MKNAVIIMMRRFTNQENNSAKKFPLLSRRKLLTFCKLFALLQCLSQVLDSVAWHYGNPIPGAQNKIVWLSETSSFSCFAINFSYLFS